MKCKIKRAEFKAGIERLDRLPEAKMPEVCLIGRSNVGKSTLINRLSGRRKLARVSATPGRTQELNFFEFVLAIDEGEERAVCLVDMPGFGYGKISKEKREDLSLMTVRYIGGREGLGVVCLLNDCRRLPEREELAIRDLAFRSDRNLLVVLTKLDKLSGNERRKQVSAISKAYGLAPDDLVLSGEKTPGEEVWSRMLPLL